MKIVVLENIFSDKEPYITLRPDNAILRNNDDFYIPHFSGDIRCGCGLVIRITRLAKCIAPKFASRCYDSITVGVTFIARDILDLSLAEHRPCDEAYAFDHSTAIGTEWIEPQSLGDGVVTMTIGASKQTFSVSTLKESIDSCIAIVSQKLTLKTGDLVFIAMPQQVKIQGGDNIVATLNDSQTLNFQIK